MKKGRGRPEKTFTTRELDRRHLSGQRLRTYMENTFTVRGLADALNIGVSTVQRWRSDEFDITSGGAEILERFTGIIKEYWTGEAPDLMTEAEYIQWMQERAEDQRELDDITGRVQQKFRATISQYESLFAACGFRYECLADPSSVHDMVIVLSGEEGERMAGEVWHRLTAYKDPSVQYHFTQARFASILQRLQDTVAFECFRNNENGDYDGYDGRRASQILTSV